MKTRLYLDLETYSALPIKYGVHAYAQHASTEILIVTWAVNDGAVHTEDMTIFGGPSDSLRSLLTDPKVEVFIHNSSFDLTLIFYIWAITVALDRVHDTMVQALAHSLPAALGELGTALGLPTDKAKDKAGKKLIHLFCKPLGKNRKLDRATRETHPAEWEQFKDYAAQDIVAMRECVSWMPTLNNTASEKALWILDQQINDRGVLIDMDLVNAAFTAVEDAKVGLAAQTTDMTNGSVSSMSQTLILRRTIFEQFGIDMPDLQMATVEKMIANPVCPPALAELLDVRLQATSTSTSKYKVLQHATNRDGRLRGVLQFNGASRTGRWAGRVFQPQNLPRPALKNTVIDKGIEALKAGCAHLVVDNVMELCSSAMRGVIVAPAGKKLVIADLSNIEGRVQAWLSQETWKIEAFTDFDTGDGPDLYKWAYAKAFDIDVNTVTPDQRQIGKVMELALAYAGGVGAFVTFANSYGINLEDLAKKILPAVEEGMLLAATEFYEWAEKSGRDQYGLSQDAFVTCEILKRVWRAAHPAISQSWSKLQQAITSAITSPGNAKRCLMLEITYANRWLQIKLPSGRTLCYPDPRIDDKQFSYMGTNQFTRAWLRIQSHGGKFYENIVQAIARDVFASSMPLVEDAGYQIVLHVHDELITEAVEDPELSADGLAGLMSVQPSWALGLPLAAAGFETYRYRKG
jgi:DNA polymerase